MQYRGLRFLGSSCALDDARCVRPPHVFSTLSVNRSANAPPHLSMSASRNPAPKLPRSFVVLVASIAASMKRQPSSGSSARSCLGVSL